MAIGNNYQNNNSGNSNNGNGRGLYENTYYSRLRFKNDNLALNVSFRAGLLILEISEVKEGFKYEALETIHISPTKAKLFAEEISKFKKYYAEGNIVEGRAFGVNAGMNEKVSYIAIHANEDKDILITIGKIDGQGNILEQATTALNRDYHFALEWNDVRNMDVEKVYNDVIELDQLYEIVLDFSRHMNGVMAYSVADLTRYDNARILSKMDPIYDKLGIERRSSNGNSSYGTGNSFLENSGRVSSRSTTIDDMEEDLLG